jgi:acyl-CoA thioesterase FadM
VVNVQSNFRAELAAGDAIRLETSIIDVGTKSMTFRHRMFRADGNLLAFETVFKCVMFDLEARISRDIPDEVRARASQFLEEA